MGSHWAGLVGDPGESFHYLPPSLTCSAQFLGAEVSAGPGSGPGRPSSRPQDSWLSTWPCTEWAGQLELLCPPTSHGFLARASVLCLPASHSLMASLLSLLAPVLASSRRADPSAMEVEPKKLKGKRDLVMPKSFQQVDFWCKWSWGLFLGYTSLHPSPPPHLCLGYLQQ